MNTAVLKKSACQSGIFIKDVGNLVNKRLSALTSSVGINGADHTLRPGKMLRTRLAARLYEAGQDDGDDNHDVLLRACAAIELAHTGSLCHDDVIDSGIMRRFMPSLWRHLGSTGSVLVGDLLLCEAMKLIAETSRPPLTNQFVEKLKEVVQTETIQELAIGSEEEDEKKFILIARGKTGPLFAFPAMVSGGRDSKLSTSLEEAGYLIGAAYQLGDDLLDEAGSESKVGKTLGADRARRKPTLPQNGPNGTALTENVIAELLKTAADCLEHRPQYREALLDFIYMDMLPIFEKNAIFVKGLYLST